MKSRELIVTHEEHGISVAGRCSRCYRPFKPTLVTATEAHSQLLREFEGHVCDEDFSRAAALSVRETTDKS